MNLRDYQKNILNQVLALPASTNPLIQLDTGAGKTPIIAALIQHWHDEEILVIAHRNILIEQASTHLARFGITHHLIAAKPTVSRCKLKSGAELISDTSQVHVASIDSLHSRLRHQRLAPINPKRIIIDEAHHAIEKNKWGKLQELYPNAQIIGFTATPCRADGFGLSRDTNGLFDVLLRADELRENSVQTLIERHYLSGFVVYGINPKLSFSSLKLRAHDYDLDQLADLIANSQLAGDAVKEYKRLALGLRCVVFCARIRNANDQVKQFRAAGISAAVVHSELGSSHVAEIMADFAEGRISVLCSVDMIGEGYDCPEVGAIIMQRKTLSFGLYRQQVGRALRVANGKDKAIIIDQVGNTFMHGMPDKPIPWSLGRNTQLAHQSNLIPCEHCHALIIAWALTCAHCGKPNARDYITRHKGSDSWIDFEVLDMQLIELKRRQLEEKVQFETALHYPSLGSDVISQTIHKLRAWLVEQVQADFSIAELNRFLSDHQDRRWWMQHFTIKDLKTQNPQKCKKLVQACLK